MGLDMYLNKHHYIGNRFRKKIQLVKVTIPKNQKGIIFPTNKIKNERISEIIEEVGYWRKANAIHYWFVKNVQNGEDDCDTYFVGMSDIKKLLNDVSIVLENHEKASELLPTQSGFFFGGTDYDDYYFQDLEYTKKILEEIVKEGENASFSYYYQSSW